MELENNSGVNLTRVHLSANTHDTSENMNRTCSAIQRNDFEYIRYSKAPKRRINAQTLAHL
jgi:hypothetical protein